MSGVVLVAVGVAIGASRRQRQHRGRRRDRARSEDQGADAGARGRASTRARSRCAAGTVRTRSRVATRVCRPARGPGSRPGSGSAGRSRRGPRPRSRRGRRHRRRPALGEAGRPRDRDAVGQLAQDLSALRAVWPCRVWAGAPVSISACTLPYLSNKIPRLLGSYQGRYGGRDGAWCAPSGRARGPRTVTRRAARGPARGWGSARRRAGGRGTALTFFHPDYTVGPGLSPGPTLRLAGLAYAIPPIGNFTLP